MILLIPTIKYNISQSTALLYALRLWSLSNLDLRAKLKTNTTLERKQRSSTIFTAIPRSQIDSHLQYGFRHVLATASMCGCTLYDSPSCGHSWMSMSQPCGFLSDLLSCPNRYTYQTLVAPPYTCPVCNGGFADSETIEMVQGPWGCNQLIRNNVGGNYAVPGQWGNIPFPSHGFAGPALTSGPFMGPNSLVPMSGYNHDHRLTGPYAQPLPVMGNGQMAYDGYDGFHDGFGYNWDSCGRNRRKHRSSRYNEYRYSSKPATNCTVM